MEINTKLKIILLAYIGVSLIPPALAFYGIYSLGLAEYGVSAHIYSLILSTPLGWLSYNQPHGSVLATCMASILGIGQWVTVYALYSLKHNRKL